MDRSQKNNPMREQNGKESNHSIKTASKQDRTLASSAFKETNRPPSVGMICRFFTFSTNCGFFVAATATISSKSCKTSISSQTHPSNVNTKKGKKSSTTSHSKKNETDRETERENTLMNTKYNRNYISKRSSKKTSMDCWGRNFVGEICICFCTRTLR